jgi:hypothetical protein
VGADIAHDQRRIIGGQVTAEISSPEILPTYQSLQFVVTNPHAIEAWVVSDWAIKINVFSIPRTTVKIDGHIGRQFHPLLGPEIE